MAQPTSIPRLLGKDIFVQRSSSIAVLEGQIRGGGPMHDHDFMEIQIVVSGRGTHCTLGEDCPVEAGDAFIIRPGAIHNYRDCARLRVMVCCVGLELLGRELAWMREDPAMSYLLWGGPLSLDRRGIIALRLMPAKLRHVVQTLRLLRKSLELDQVHSRAGHIGQLLLALNELASTVRADPRGQLLGSSKQHVAVVKAIRLFEGDPTYPWSLDQVAEQLRLAKSYFIRLFKSQTGLTPIAYLCRIRAEHAAKLLLQTDQPIGIVGQVVGWDDPTYFSRRFKAYYGISPSEYRARASEGEQQQQQQQQQHDAVGKTFGR